ncbi:conserved hypothetical protein [Talaromyces stipitatus ATCC 10500]|uniref:Zn(2)-C6 fungal-type domain-containing protein n=1 Tax=Talaromyces stipitatus (strain ATCC 10500 / CBS 375.48 / QM 6759 / NRRL 1006) TaxID=441959 RepID=B8MCB0_TALSN|nr:uncharacterized protein TSTA_122850 [Talaromyces stipitatus ATCC 10500]EED18556.1 conserved hypothetical protein [Talaromyces stipitatus ATCC 10500]
MSMTRPKDLPNAVVTEKDTTNVRRLRRWAPKARTGCLTCKIRRIKCDEIKPSCKKCTSTGRKCDGYEDCAVDTQPIGSIRSSTSVAKKTTRSRALVPAAAPIYSVSWLPFYGGELQKRNFDFFQSVTSSALSSFYGSEFWASETLQVAHQYPALFHAITAFGSIHHGYLSDTTPLDVPRTGKNDHIEFGLQEFNKAIKSMSALISQKELSAQDQQAILTTCILFTGLSSLQGRQSQAFMHVKNGLRMIHHWRLNSRLISSKEKNAVDMLLLTFIQLDTQIRPYLAGQESFLQWIDEVIVSPSSRRRIFRTVFEAYFDLEIFLNELFRLDFNAYSFDQLYIEIDLLNKQADIWDRQFGQLLSTITPNISDMDALVAIRLRREYARAILSSLVVNGKDNVHDEMLPTYQVIVNLAQKILQKDSRASLSGVPNNRKLEHPIFVLGSTVVEPLFLAATRCREPILRRQALQLLRQCPRREGICEGMMAVRIVQEVIEVEEEGCLRSVDWRRRHSASPTTASPYRSTSPCRQFLPSRGCPDSLTQNNFRGTTELPDGFMNHINGPISPNIEEMKTIRSKIPTEKSQCSEKGKWVCEQHRVVDTQFLLLTERQLKIVIWTKEDRESNRMGREMVLTWW